MVKSWITMRLFALAVAVVLSVVQLVRLACGFEFSYILAIQASAWLVLGVALKSRQRDKCNIAAKIDNE